VHYKHALNTGRSSPEEVSMNAYGKVARWALAAALASAVVALVACNVGGPAPDPTLGGQDLASFQKVYMSSYYAEQGGTGTPLGSRALAPFPRAATPSRATVPISSSTTYTFSALVGNTTTLAGYPEPGQTTKFTVTSRDSANHVYDVTATTTYPASDIRLNYVEEYYVRDIGVDPATTFTSVNTPDGTWTVDDPIVKLVGPSWTQDQKSRVRQVLTFTDGTTRTETIVSQTDFTTGIPRFASFDPAGSLDFGQLFYPSADTGAVFSSVVVYDVAPATNPNYWFWSGSSGQHILGIRYYTEFKDTTAGKYYAYTILFEKTLSTLTTQAGSFTQTLQTVFVGSQFDTLAESVLRQKTTFDLVGGVPSMATGLRTTNMQTRVVNISGRKDFFLQQQNSDYAQLSSWATSTIYTPTGSAAEVLATDPTAFLFNRSEITQTGGGATLPVAVTDTSGLGDLATLYTSLTEGAAVVSTSIPTPPGSLQPSNTAWSFNGAQKGSVLDPNPAYDLSRTGTIETWVYVNQQVDTAGIVHKGVLPDFSDECFSLQFWGNGGQLAFVLDGPTATASGGYDLLTSTINLNTKRWYYIVATWDMTTSPKTIKLYINGALNKTVTPSYAANGARVVPGAGLVIGSQLPAQYNTLYGYFSLNGKLVGTKLSATVATAAQVLTNYNAFLPNTVSW
jgi:hypothetical protein